ncbi:trehalose-phosphatase [Novosphingobium mangrovi (ex Hu et al. 2023)]|uniref:Trehalose 6-phosphate phosphatase n=1 Tax=Novosphingobium mangrovi (ex Hu et al. 2023) TaxID=2930094 RepID=A0ABT0AC96_9SPHN|nr:trehalose-phosphatase [Novosphingobium mangrovi (ex Hu et al. 2023)]MCJ1960804.1 trehalose-phosphatase [Novosphingobium mangrovi (ex Hu et al. 2023)]
MTDPSDSLSLAEQGSGPTDLPPPSPLRIASQTALFLDFDGTLVEIADHPDEVIVPETLPGVIAALAEALEGRLALVSGRSIAALETLLGPLDVAIAGSHGGEFRPAGTHTVAPLAASLPDRVVTHLSEFARANGNMLVEPKPYSVAVHYRHHPEALEGLLARAEALAHEEDLKLKHGKQVVELVMPGSDKGSALTAFMERPEFAGTQPLFLGDDVTDEDAFRVLEELGGHGVLVGPMRATAAHRRLPDVAAVHDWLAAALRTHDQSEGI